MLVANYKLIEGRDDISLDAYIADDSEEITRGGKRPAVIVVPGGAYVIRSEREEQPIAFRFLGMGYHAFVLKYSVLTKHEGSWPENPEEYQQPVPDVVHPQPMVELGLAMLKIREHADEWNLDVNQIGIIGFSAGGHLCAMYSSCYCKPILTQRLNASPEQLRPAFCVLGYPFIDWEAHMRLMFNDPFVRAAYEMMYLDYFGTKTPSVEQQRECSANYQVTEQNPPTFLWNTSTDPGVPVMHTLSMASALAKHGVPFEIHSFGEGQHGLSLADVSTAGGANEVNDVVAQWVPLMQVWLKKYVKFPQI